ncbi:DUF5994 family protein [Microlunatus ginsengisoli]|uniref:DUF5994 family protein n=1 Tax=Microlunatus ginsengisoli TaxID=363863 RepID=A0ABP7AQD8_9ACTN
MSVSELAAPPNDRTSPTAVTLPAPRRSNTPVEKHPLRLQLAASIGRGALDGAWWPYSRDLAVEAVALVDHFPAGYDRICHIAYSTPDWDVSRRRLTATKGYVRLGSFPHDDTHRVILVGVSAHAEQILQLLVVPFDCDARAARHAMRTAATPSNSKSATTILLESQDQDRADLLLHWDDDGGTAPSSGN